MGGGSGAFQFIRCVTFLTPGQTSEVKCACILCLYKVAVCLDHNFTHKRPDTSAFCSQYRTEQNRVE